MLAFFVGLLSVVKTTFGSNDIDVNTLLEQRTKYTIVDFQSQYLRELQGFVKDSILINDDDKIEMLER